MAIALTTDPIISVADVQTLIPGLTVTDRVNFLINSVSAAFMQFTGRLAINSDDVVQIDHLPSSPDNYLYLRATPVTSVDAVTILYDGEDDEVLASTEYTLESATSGRMVLPNYTVAGRGCGYRVKIEFEGGWATVPGDIQAAALEAIVYKREKLDGRAGMRSASIEGQSTSYEGSDLPQSVQDCWRKYRIY
jgi:hypothetical protein